jgi:hypothetical protein
MATKKLVTGSVQGRHGASREAAAGGSTRLWLVLGSALVILSAALFALPRWSGPAGGTLSPEYTRHDLGAVRMGDGLLLARFPLTVEGTPLVMSLSTT